MAPEITTPPSGVDNHKCGKIQNIETNKKGEKYIRNGILFCGRQINTIN